MKQPVYFLLSICTFGLATTSAAQVPVVTSRTPARNTTVAPISSTVGLTFSQPVDATSVPAISIYSATAGGKKKGTYATTDKTVTFSPTSAFKAGETVVVSVPAALRSTANVAAARQVYQFTTGVGGNGRAQNFRPSPHLSAGQACYSFVAGDIDNDGDIDLVATNQLQVTHSSLILLLNGGDNSGSNTGVFSYGKAPQLSIDNVWGSALGDVDGDGDLDIVLATMGGLCIFKNGGSADGKNAGVFYSGYTTVAVGRTPRNLTLGDVDGDGDLDIVSADSEGGSFTVCLNGGDSSGSNTGDFSKKTTVALAHAGVVSGSPVTVALADVDGDGDLDVLASSYNTVSVRLNGGDATGSNTGIFSGTQEVSLPGGLPTYSCLTTGDIDGDGDLDFAISGSDATNRACVSVRLNGGDASGSNTGIFSGTQQFSVPEVATGLVFGDVDADGDVDLAIATRSNKALIRLNGGDASGSHTGLFSGGTSMPTGDDSYGVGLADLDGDGDLDLVTSDYGPNSSSLSIGLNQPPAPVITSLNPAKGVAGTVVTLTGTTLTETALKVGGKVTPITSNTGTSLTFTVPAGTAPTGGVTVTTAGGVATQAFAVAVTVVKTSPKATSSAASSSVVQVSLTEPATFNSAARLAIFSAVAGGQRTGYVVTSGNDLFSYGAAFQPGEEVSVSVPASIVSNGGIGVSKYVYRFTMGVRGTGRGTFQAGAEVDLATQAVGFTTTDVDGDGDQDLVVATATSTGSTVVKVRLNAGNGTFTAGLEVPLTGNPGVRDLVATDLDGDGDLDILTANSQTNTVSLLVNNGKGIFTAAPALLVGAAPQQVLTADVNGDGIQDVLTLNGGSHTVSIRPALGYYAFLSGSEVAVEAGAQALVTGDIDNDGDLDLLTANGSSQTVSVRLNDGNGLFTGSVNLALGSTPGALTLADVDADGDLDLVVAKQQEHTVGIWLNNGQGVFSSGSTVAVGAVPGSLRLVDVDADKDLDLLVTTPSDHTVAVWLNTGSGTFGPGSTVSVGMAPQGLCVADIDGDGDVDLLTSNQDDKTVSIRLNQATLPTITSFTPTTGGSGTLVTLTGTNLTGVTEVRVGGVLVPTFTVVSATSLTFVIPASTGGLSGLITLTTLAGEVATSATPFGTTLATMGRQTAVEWQVYPNPFQHDVTVVLPNTMSAQAALYEVTGRLIVPLTLLPATGQFQLPSGLATGVYFLEVHQGGDITRRALVKQ